MPPAWEGSRRIQKELESLVWGMGIKADLFSREMVQCVYNPSPTTRNPGLRWPRFPGRSWSDDTAGLLPTWPLVCLASASSTHRQPPLSALSSQPSIFCPLQQQSSYNAVLLDFIPFPVLSYVSPSKYCAIFWSIKKWGDELTKIGEGGTHAPAK